MNDLIVQFQNMILNMLDNERITQREFEILCNLSEDIEKGVVAKLIQKLTPADCEDQDIADCILEKHYETAWNIISDEPWFMEMKPELAEEAKELFGGD